MLPRELMRRKTEYRVYLAEIRPKNGKLKEKEKSWTVKQGSLS